MNKYVLKYLESKVFSSCDIIPFDQLNLFQIFGFQAALTSLDNKGLYCIPVPVIPSFSTAVYGKLIKFPKYW